MYTYKKHIYTYIYKCIGFFRHGTIWDGSGFRLQGRAFRMSSIPPGYFNAKALSGAMQAYGKYSKADSQSLAKGSKIGAMSIWPQRVDSIAGRYCSLTSRI